MSAHTIYIDGKIRKEFRAEFPETARAIKDAGISKLGDEYAGNIASSLHARGEHGLAHTFLDEIGEAAESARY